VEATIAKQNTGSRRTLSLPNDRVRPIVIGHIAVAHHKEKFLVNFVVLRGRCDPALIMKWVKVTIKIAAELIYCDNRCSRLHTVTYI